MATLSPPAITRARSSSTVGPITTPRSRTVSSTKPNTHHTTVEQSTSGACTTVGSGGNMFDTLVQIASRLIPFHDALSTTASLPSYSTDEKYIPLDVSVINTTTASVPIDEKSVRWGEHPVTTTLEYRSENERRTRPPPPYKPRRNRSPFSSLFIKPPSSSALLLPPPVSSPSKFNPISIVPSTPHSTDPSLITPLLFVCSLFFITFIPTIVLIYTLPIPSLKAIPRTLEDIKDVATQLQIYSASSFQGRAHILAVLAVTSIWKNAWSVPGSVLLNVLAGALMNPILATLLQTFLTAIGSICSTLLSKPLGPIISKLFPKALSITRFAFEGTPQSSPNMTPTSITPAESEDEQDADDVAQTLLTQKTAVSEAQATAPTPIWVRLTILRLIGVVPWSALNLACGICDVPLWDCALGAFIGVLPWTAVTCQVGDLLQTVAVKTSSDAGAPAETLSSLLSSPSIIAKLVILSTISLAPILLRDKLSRIVTRRTTGRRSRTRRSREIIDLASPTPVDEKTRTA